MGDGIREADISKGLSVGDWKVSATKPVLLIRDDDGRVRIAPTDKMTVTYPSGSKQTIEAKDKFLCYLFRDRLEPKSPLYVPSSLPKELGRRLAYDAAPEFRKVRFLAVIFDICLCAEESDEFATDEGWFGFEALRWNSNFPKQFAPHAMQRAVDHGWMKPTGSKVLNVAKNSNSTELNMSYRSLIVRSESPKHMAPEMVRDVLDTVRDLRVKKALED